MDRQGGDIEGFVIVQGSAERGNQACLQDVALFFLSGTRLRILNAFVL
jgi:hypothetical protein